jgi:hypothetical protein
LKERAGKYRRPKFDVEDNEKNPDETPPDAHLHKLAGIGHDRRREQNRPGHSNEPLRESHIFQNRLMGEPSDLLKQYATDEQRLIAINYATASATKVVEERNQFEPPITAGKLMHEPAGLNRMIVLHLI